FVLEYKLSPKIKYGIPFYFQNTWVCYVNPMKKDKGVELNFVRARELEQTIHLLDFKDRKMVAGFTYYSIKEIDESLLKLVLEEAIQLDIDHPKTKVIRK
ncbi:MAG: hypothetical protein AAGK97_15235, partial [Bacteroidota bacterium]